MLQRLPAWMQDRLARVELVGWFRLEALAVSLLFLLLTHDILFTFRLIFWSQICLSLSKPFIRLYYFYAHGIDISPSSKRACLFFFRLDDPKPQSSEPLIFIS